MCFVSSVLTVLFCCWMAVAMWNCCRLGAHFVYTIQLSTRLTVSHHVKPHTRVQVCLDVTCHLHFWQNDQNLLVLFAAAVTWGWNGCQNKCQRKKLTMGKKTLFLPGLKPVIFSNESSALTNEISLLPGTLFAQNVHALTTAILCCLAVLSISSQTTKSLRQRCSPFPESSPNWPYLSSCFSPLAAHWCTDTVQTCFPVLQLPQLDRPCLLDWTPERFQTNPPAMLFFWYFHSLFSLCGRALT